MTPQLGAQQQLRQQAPQAQQQGGAFQRQSQQQGGGPAYDLEIEERQDNRRRDERRPRPDAPDSNAF